LAFATPTTALFDATRSMSGDALLDRNLEAALGLGTVIEALEVATGQSAAHSTLDGIDQWLVGRRDKGEGVAHHACAGGAADAVDVIVGLCGDVEVDDVRQGLDVNSAGSDVGGHEYPDAPVLERRQRGLALRLAAVSVDPITCDTGPRQLFRETVGAVLGSGEDQRGFDIASLKHFP
jgi:hypothetical protein